MHALVARGRALEPQRGLAMVRQVCNSLAEAHGCGIVHRDLKPFNVFLTRHGEQRDLVTVLDFGLVKELGRELRRGLARPVRACMGGGQRGRRSPGRCRSGHPQATRLEAREAFPVQNDSWESVREAFGNQVPVDVDGASGALDFDRDSSGVANPVEVWVIGRRRGRRDSHL